MAERRTGMVRPWAWALGGFVAVLLLAFALVVGPWLLTRHPERGLTAEQALKAKNDVRNTLVQALAGLAVAGGLAVTYSTYRQNQRDQADRRAAQDRAHQLNLATHVNDLYTKAVEQLGHTQAPVRLGAVHSLVHLAQANPAQRQTVVDVLCAYLRMPYSEPPEGEETEPKWAEILQERQVRQTAQALLGQHLRRPEGMAGQDAQHLPPSPDQPFWPGINVDLGGAVLLNFSFHRASVFNANFYRATFIGMAWFGETTFTGGASFSAATFADDAWFSETTFNRDAMFHHATFSGCAWFHGATFADAVSFSEVTFTRWSFFFGARVLRLDVPHLTRDTARMWPQWWSVSADPDDPTRGELIRATDAPPMEAMDDWPPRSPRGAPLAMWADWGVTDP